MNAKQTGQRFLANALAVLLLSLPPLHASANPRKGEIDALYRPVDGRLLKLRTMLPPRRDEQGNEQPDRSGCPETVSIGSLEKDKGSKVFNFSPEIYVDGPIVIDCRR